MFEQHVSNLNLNTPLDYIHSQSSVIWIFVHESYSSNCLFFKISSRKELDNHSKIEASMQLQKGRIRFSLEK